MQVKFNIPGDRGKLYEVIKYPAGEIQTRLTGEGIALVTSSHTDSYEITANPIPDLIELAQLNDAIQATAWLQGCKLFSERSLSLPYLPFARADRRFVGGDTAGFHIFMSQIEPMSFTSVWTFDAHNASMAEEYGVLNVLPTDNQTDQIKPIIRDLGRKGLVLVLPDAGAAKRYDLSKYKLPVMVADKVRDAATGKLIGFSIGSGIKIYKKALLIDDICDGGGTFIGQAEAIHRKNKKCEVSLYVSHGIFSKGVDALLDGGIKNVYISNYSIKGQDYNTFETIGETIGETE